jgi:hypothetical protein
MPPAPVPRFRTLLRRAQQGSKAARFELITRGLNIVLLLFRVFEEERLRRSGLSYVLFRQNLVRLATQEFSQFTGDREREFQDWLRSLVDAVLRHASTAGGGNGHTVGP